MTISLNGTSMTEVYLNGTRMEIVNINGEEVYRAENGNVTLVSSGSNTFSPGAEDLNRHFVILSGRFTASTTSTGPVPTINGASGTTIKNAVDNSNDDGGRCGIFTFKIPTGTGTFTVANVDSNFCVYKVTGITSMAAAFATAQNSGGSTISVTSPTNGCGFVVAVNNFGSVGALTGTDTDLRYNPGNPGFGANRAVTSGTHVFEGATQVNIAATFEYDL